MKKDILIPEVSNVFMAIAYEYNEAFRVDEWNVYIINNKEVDLEMVLINSKGFDQAKKIETSLMRHKIEILPAKSFAKVEYLQDDVAKLTNKFTVTFFENSQLFDKQFIFEKGTIKTGGIRVIPLLNKKGILVK